jgi:hypothetical protein
VGCFAGPWFFPCVFVWVPLGVVFGCFFQVLGLRFCGLFGLLWVSFGGFYVYFLYTWGCLMLFI